VNARATPPLTILQACVRPSHWIGEPSPESHAKTPASSEAASTTAPASGQTTGGHWLTPFEQVASPRWHPTGMLGSLQAAPLGRQPASVAPASGQITGGHWPTPFTHVDSPRWQPTGMFGSEHTTLGHAPSGPASEAVATGSSVPPQPPFAATQKRATGSSVNVNRLMIAF
jgi:hypothetical protein